MHRYTLSPLHPTPTRSLRLEGDAGEAVVPPLEGRVVGKVLDQELDSLGVLLLGLAVQLRDLRDEGLVLLGEWANVVVEGFLQEEGGVEGRRRVSERSVPRAYPLARTRLDSPQTPCCP